MGSFPRRSASHYGTSVCISDDRTSPAGFSLRTGEVSGWAALLEDQPQRIATATCLEKSTVLLINGTNVLKLLESDPASGYLVMRRPEP